MNPTERISHDLASSRNDLRDLVLYRFRHLGGAQIQGPGLIRFRFAKGSPGADAPREGSHLVPTHGMVSVISTNRETSILGPSIQVNVLSRCYPIVINWIIMNRVFDLAKSVPDHTINLPLYALIKLLCRVRSDHDEKRITNGKPA